MSEEQKQKPEQTVEDKLRDHRPFNGPMFRPTSFQLQGLGTDFNVMLQVAVPAESSEGTMQPEYARLVNVAMITMSPGAMKDLSVLLRDNIEIYEREYGPVNTPFLKQRQSQKT